MKLFNSFIKNILLKIIYLKYSNILQYFIKMSSHKKDKEHKKKKNYDSSTSDSDSDYETKKKKSCCKSCKKGKPCESKNNENCDNSKKIEPVVRWINNPDFNCTPKVVEKCTSVYPANPYYPDCGKEII